MQDSGRRGWCLTKLLAADVQLFCTTTMDDHISYTQWVDVTIYSQIWRLFTPPARRAWRSYKFASLRFSVFFPVTSWATAHAWYRCAVYRLLSEPISTRLLNSISTGTCRQNTQFNMYSTTSKQQEGCTFKDSHPKCSITTNFDKFHREAVAKCDESRWSFDSMFPW